MSKSLIITARENFTKFSVQGGCRVFSTKRGKEYANVILINDTINHPVFEVDDKTFLGSKLWWNRGGRGKDVWTLPYGSGTTTPGPARNGLRKLAKQTMLMFAINLCDRISEFSAKTIVILRAKSIMLRAAGFAV